MAKDERSTRSAHTPPHQARSSGVANVHVELDTVTSANPSVYELALPAMVLGSASLAYVTRLTRTNLTENLRSDYVRTAVSKGLTRRRAIGLHALRNSLIPVVTFIGFDFGALLGGAIVTERIFNIPGIGGYIYRSIRSRDGASVVGAVTVVVATLSWRALGRHDTGGDEVSGRAA